MTREIIGEKEGRKLYSYTINNSKGMKVVLSNYGATMLRLFVPDSCGELNDVVAGYEHIEDYYENSEHVGCIVAPTANRIAKGHCVIDGKEYQLQINNGVNNLHTHVTECVRNTVMDVEEKENEIVFSCFMADGFGGLPGNREFEVSYRLDEENRLTVTYHMSADRPTLFNPTCHSYFNLAGHDHGTVLDHRLKLNCGYYTPVDETLIPTGEILPVDNTPFDFRKGKKIGEEIGADDRQLRIGAGYDHNFVIDGYDGSLRECAVLTDENSGRQMKVYTTQPGIQVYTANYLTRKDGKDGTVYHENDAVCLETQFFPDNVNHENFASAIMNGERTYQTVFEFFW